VEIGREIKRHLEWIESIASLFATDRITEEKVQEVSRHNHCALGQWLDSDASAIYKTLPEFEQLRESHEAFHKLAGELIGAIEAEKEPEALAYHEKFIEMSQNVIANLNVLKEKSAARSEAGDSHKTA